VLGGKELNEILKKDAVLTSVVFIYLFLTRISVIVSSPTIFYFSVTTSILLVVLMCVFFWDATNPTIMKIVISDFGYALCFGFLYSLSASLFAVLLPIKWLWASRIAELATFSSIALDNPFYFYGMALFIGPITEELVFRKFLYGLFLKHRITIGSIIVCVLFSVAHDYSRLGALLVYFLFSLQQNAIYKKTNNVLLCIVVHAVFNATNIFIVSDTEHIFASSVIIGLLYLLLATVGLVVFVIYFNKRLMSLKNKSGVTLFDAVFNNIIYLTCIAYFVFALTIK
jgi:membrane protease YdiL (CAAX protease family)